MEDENEQKVKDKFEAKEKFVNSAQDVINNSVNNFIFLAN